MKAIPHSAYLNYLCLKKKYIPIDYNMQLTLKIRGLKIIRASAFKRKLL